MIRRSLRLDAIYAWVDGNVVADIGCDHGYIPLWCVQDKGIKAYACDVASKPLERARALFKQEEADIPCLLMDGIEGLPGDVDQIVIAGNGRPADRTHFGAFESARHAAGFDDPIPA